MSLSNNANEVLNLCKRLLDMRQRLNRAKNRKQNMHDKYLHNLFLVKSDSVDGRDGIEYMRTTVRAYDSSAKAEYVIRYCENAIGHIENDLNDMVSNGH